MLLYLYSLSSEPEADCLNSFHFHSQLYPKFLGLLRATKINTHTHIYQHARTKATKIITIFGIVTFSLLRKVRGIPVTVVTTTYDPRRPIWTIISFPTPLQRSRKPLVQSKFHTPIQKKRECYGFRV